MIWLSDPQFQTKDFGTLENVLYPQSAYNINQNVCIWDRSVLLFSYKNLLDKTKVLTES